MMIQNKTNQTLKLKDGRTLGFAEYGDSQGKPIFEFHGNPSSRLGSGLFDETAKRMGIRVIGIDRPGMGMSIVARIMRNNPDKALSKMFEELPPSDRAAFDNPRVKQQYIDTIREAFRAGPDGVTLDIILTMKPWGF
jgi:pimeloyl-ACP methyl ester carboxylesterase